MKTTQTTDVDAVEALRLQVSFRGSLTEDFCAARIIGDDALKRFWEKVYSDHDIIVLNNGYVLTIGRESERGLYPPNW
jgi:hypothetical protein